MITHAVVPEFTGLEPVKAGFCLSDTVYFVNVTGAKTPVPYFTALHQAILHIREQTPFAIRAEDNIPLFKYDGKEFYFDYVFRRDMENIEQMMLAEQQLGYVQALQEVREHMGLPPISVPT